MEVNAELRVADQAWLGLALLHRRHPERLSFSARKIMDCLKQKELPEVRAGVQAHIYLHNVANLPPNPAQYRMFYRLEDGSFRLFRPGDDFHPGRSGKTKPDRSDLPAEYHHLLDWYENVYCAGAPTPEETDPVLQMRGVGREIWADVDADSYVAELRSGWSNEPAPGGDPEPSDVTNGVWQRVLAHQGEEFFTAKRLPFTYQVEGNGIWFYRNGRRMEQRLGRGDFEKAVRRCPLHATPEIADCRDYAYLFGLLNDPRIHGNDW